MDWDKCTNPNCSVSYHHSSVIEECSNPHCGNKRPRCKYCNTTFVANEHEICKHCLPDGATCDNCHKSQPSLFKTEEGEFWCFDCLPKYGDYGPALQINKDVLKKDKEYLEQLRSRNSIPSTDQLRRKQEQLKRVKKYRENSKYSTPDNLQYESPGFTSYLTKESDTLYTCMGCKKTYVTQDINIGNFCKDCLVLITNNCCTECMEDIDPNFGIDESGRCVDCTLNGEAKERDFNFSMIPICPNCETAKLKENQKICTKCLRKIEKEW